MNFKSKVINSQETLKIISKSESKLVVKAKYGPSINTKIPLELSEKLSFFVAAIIWDGHLKKEKFQITFECTNENLVLELQMICKELFKRNFNIHPRKPRNGHKDSYQLYIDSKAIYKLLEEVFEIPTGKKSNSVKIPSSINNTSVSIKSAFLIGILATEGGKRKRELGLSTSSKQLWNDLIFSFEEIGIKISKDKWTHKKYNKEYYGLVFKKRDLFSIIKKSKDRQIKEILRHRNF